MRRPRSVIAVVAVTIVLTGPARPGAPNQAAQACLDTYGDAIDAHRCLNIRGAD